MSMKKLIAAMLAASIAMTCAACARTAAPAENPTAAEENPLIVELDDFENYADDFAPLSILNSFGKVNFNKDAQYVKTGKGSARLDIIGSSTPGAAAPILRVPVNMQRKQIDASDFSKVAMIEAAMYNPDTVDRSVTVQLAQDSSYSREQKFTLKAGQWSTIAYSVDRSILALLLDITSLDFIHLSFEVADEPYVLYLDSIRIHKTEEDYVPTELTLKENEVAYFEDYWQYTMAYSQGTVGRKPTITLNTDPEFSKSGNSLKVSFTAPDSTITEDYEGMRLNTALIGAAGIRTMAAGDALVMEIYNPLEKQLRIFYQCFPRSGARLYVDNFVYLEPGWNTLRRTAAEFMAGGFDNNGNRVGAGCRMSDVWEIGWTLRYDWLPLGETVDVYMDDIRIERAQ